MDKIKILMRTAIDWIDENSLVISTLNILLIGNILINDNIFKLLLLILFLLHNLLFYIDWVRRERKYGMMKLNKRFVKKDGDSLVVDKKDINEMIMFLYEVEEFIHTNQTRI